MRAYVFVFLTLEETGTEFGGVGILKTGEEVGPPKVIEIEIYLKKESMKTHFSQELFAGFFGAMEPCGFPQLEDSI